VTRAGLHFVADGMKAVEAISARRLEQQEKTEDNAAGADVGHDEVEHAGMARFPVFVFEAHQAIGHERHDFPDNQKEEGIVRREHQGCHQEQHIEKGAKNPHVFSPIETAGITERIKRNGQTDERDQQSKEGAQGI
jgi:hypothetical protein